MLLSRYVKRTIKAILAGFTVLVFIAGCEPDNQPPVAKLEVWPTSGEIPLEVRMKVTGQDPDGSEDIKEYVLHIGSEVVKSSTPLDITRTFTSEGKVVIYGEVVDSDNQSGQTAETTIDLTLTEGINQSAVLVNSNEIEYSAILKKIASAELTINKDGNLFLKQSMTDISLTGSDFQKVFKYNPDGITKGTYEFILKAGDLEKKTTVIIPNYKSTLHLDGVSTDFEEDTEVVWNLSGRASDINPEDNPVSIISTISLNDKTKTTLSGDNLKIKSFWNNLGEYQVKIDLQNTKGVIDEYVIKGDVLKGPYEVCTNPFVSTNENGATYDLLTTKAERDAYVQQKLFEDWADAYHIPPSFPPNPEWVCGEYAKQLMTNFHGSPGATGYSGFELDSIYWYRGTLKDNGKYGLPVFQVCCGGSFSHMMNCILTGDDATNFEHWNFIEPQRDSINVKPGHLYMEMNCDIIILGSRKNRDGVIDYTGIILVFKVQNGIANLAWINDETFPLIEPYTYGKTSTWKIITER